MLQTTQKAAAPPAVSDSTKESPGAYKESAKSVSWALIHRPGSQPEKTDVHSAYNEFVAAMRGIAGQIERDGMSTDLEAAFKQPCSAAVRCLLDYQQLTSYRLSCFVQ